MNKIYSKESREVPQPPKPVRLAERLAVGTKALKIKKLRKGG